MVEKLSDNDENPIDFLIQIKSQLPDGYKIPDKEIVSIIKKYNQLNE